jgi:hypothetical protein
MLLFESACAERKEKSRKYGRTVAKRGKMGEKWKKASTERKEGYTGRSVPLSNDVLLLCTCTIYTRTAQ